MRELEALPEPQRQSLSKKLEVGMTITHKRTGREWTIKNHWRKDHAIQVTGPGVNSPMTLTYDDIKRGWIIG